MNHERLKLAIDIIRAIPEEQVRLRFWHSHMPMLAERDVDLAERITCGTVCCAAGWFTLDPEMRKAGFSCDSDGEPAFEGRTSFIALGRFFDISTDEARGLFNRRKAIENREFGEAISDKELWLRRIELFTSNRRRFNELYCE
jgi:hypothetical protein